jgi:diguanylate cyclase (GGDEF)-like protein/PAS domain S-box-containing protein
MRKALLKSFIVALAGLAAGGLLLDLGGTPWLALVTGAVAAAVAAGVFLLRHDDLLQESLAAERQRHQATREFIQRVLDVVPMPMYVKDAQSRYLIVNQAQAEQWGKPIESLIGVCSIDLAPNETVASNIRIEDAAVLAGQIIYKEEKKRHAATGEEQFRVVTKGRCLDAEGGYVIVCALYDTTHWKQTERALQEALERETLLRQRTQAFVQRLIDVIPDPLYIKDRDGAFLMVNDAFARERGKSKDELIGKVAHAIAFSQQLAQGTPEEDIEVLAGAEVDKEQHFIHPLTGEERFRQVIKRRCTNIDGTLVIVGAHFNITRWRVAERELARIANEDVLTGLPNRRQFINDADRIMSRSLRHGEPLSLLLFDLDHFKRINDELGHVVGDSVLRQLAERMRQHFRSEDLPCRWGGEEFAVLLPVSTAQDAMQVAERLRDSISRASFEASSPLSITISCGVAQWQSEESLEQLISRADAALYAAKHAGRNACMLAGI